MIKMDPTSSMPVRLATKAPASEKAAEAPTCKHVNESVVAPPPPRSLCHLV